MPRGAALQSEVLRNQNSDTPDFAVYPVTQNFLDVVDDWPETGDASSYEWVPKYRGPIGRVVLPGDTVAIAIWDNDENSLLTNQVEKVAKLQPMTVSTSGYIFLPYLGEVEVGGLTEAAARGKVQEALATVSPSAQIQFNSNPGPRHSVDLVSGILRPGSYPLVERDMTILSALSQGGGVDPTLKNPTIKLLRGNQTYGISLGTLFDNPQLDTTLRQGDKVLVEAEDKYFLALGATGVETLVQYPKDKVTALDALSLIGGVSDQRANLKGILILREYDQTAVQDSLIEGPERSRVVFTVDLASADGLFSAGNFEIMPKDLVYATESPINNVRTIFGLIGTVAGLADRLDN
ncbi:MAG: polysaccharide biosynthesis/export family protein [Pseudomonadota bacterium]